MDGAGEFIPEELFGAGVSVAAALGESGGDAGKTLALGKFSLGRCCATRGVAIGGIDTCDGRSVGACESLEDNFADLA